MKPLSNEELSHIHSLLVDESSEQHHHPNNFDEEEHKMNSELLGRFWNEAKRRGLWWAR